MDEILSCLKDLAFYGSNYFPLKECVCVWGGWVVVVVGDEGSAEAARLEFNSSKPKVAGLRRVSIRMDCRSLEGAGAPAEPTSWGS